MNMTLFTKDGRRVGNGIIIGGEPSAYCDDYLYVIETDYGNTMKLNLKELEELYYLGHIVPYDQWKHDRTETRTARENLENVFARTKS